MFKFKREFLIGLFAAVFAFIGLFNISRLQAAGKYRTKAYINFALEHNLFEANYLTRRNLNKPIRRLQFQQMTNKILRDLNVVSEINLSKLVESGIFVSEKGYSKLTRSKGLEILLRAITYIWNTNQAKFPRKISNNKPFRDYVVSPKYNMAMNFALNRALVKGMRNGNFYPGRRLKIKNAIILVNRFYNIFNGIIKSNHSINNEIKFKEKVLTQSNENEVKILKNAGTFKFVNLDLDMAGHKRISVNRFSKLILGILSQNNKRVYMSEVKLLRKKFGPGNNLNRAQLAMFSSALASAFAHREYNEYPLYADVKPNSDAGLALQTLSKIGIRMGYPGGKLIPNERVTGYEALGIVKEIIKKIKKSSSVYKPVNVATKSDIFDIEQRIRARKNFIRRLLSQNN